MTEHSCRFPMMSMTDSFRSLDETSHRAEFVVPGEPKGKARPRFARHGSYVSAYTPRESLDYEARIRTEYERNCGLLFEDSPVVIDIRAYFPIPKRTSKKKRELMNEGLIVPTKKPDIDNICKAVLDGLCGSAFNDDSQVTTMIASKHYSDEPRVEVKIWTDGLY